MSITAQNIKRKKLAGEVFLVKVYELKHHEIKFNFLFLRPRCGRYWLPTKLGSSSGFMYLKLLYRYTSEKARVLKNTYTQLSNKLFFIMLLLLLTRFKCF